MLHALPHAFFIQQNQAQRGPSSAMAEWGVEQKENRGKKEEHIETGTKKTLGERRQNLMTSSGGI